jgi:hypothetical protein
LLLDNLKIDVVMLALPGIHRAGTSSEVGAGFRFVARVLAILVQSSRIINPVVAVGAVLRVRRDDGLAFTFGNFSLLELEELVQAGWGLGHGELRWTNAKVCWFSERSSAVGRSSHFKFFSRPAMEVKRPEHVYCKLRAAVAQAALTDSLARVAIRFKVTEKFVRYWKEKLLDPAFHALPLGGAYRTKYSSEEDVLLQVRARAILACVANGSDLRRFASRVCCGLSCASSRTAPCRSLRWR